MLKNALKNTLQKIDAYWQRGLWTKVTIVLFAVECVLVVVYVGIWLLLGLDIVSFAFKLYYCDKLTKIVVTLGSITTVTFAIGVANGELEDH